MRPVPFDRLDAFFVCLLVDRLTVKTSVKRAGIGYQTARRWLRRLGITKSPRNPGHGIRACSAISWPWSHVSVSNNASGNDLIISVTNPVTVWESRQSGSFRTKQNRDRRSMTVTNPPVSLSTTRSPSQ
jgi:hypothetical protein